MAMAKQTKTNSNSDPQPHNETENNSVIRTRSIFLIAGSVGLVAGLITVGIVSIHALSVMKSSDCGSSLSYRSSPSSHEFHFRKEPCDKTLPKASTLTVPMSTDIGKVRVVMNRPLVVKVDPSFSDRSIPVIKVLKQRDYKG